VHTNKLIGIIDIGSNSTMMTISTIDSTNPIFIGELCEVTQLAKGVDHHGFLNKLAMDRTYNAIAWFVKEAKALGIHTLFGTATSAVRDAKNGQDFIHEINSAFNLDLVILQGEEEAAAVFLGTTADLPIGQKVITCDPGGGSTEINIGIVGQSPFYGKSFNVGCVRQSDRFQLHGTPNSKQIIKAQKEIEKQIAPAFKQVDPQDYLLVITAGTATTYAAMNLRLQSYSNQKVHHTIGKQVEVEKWAKKLFTMPISEREKLPCVGSRASTLPTGLLIMNEVLKGFKKKQFTISTKALRHGILLKKCQELLAEV
jgi:exopolyphosphatase/guanosine-5'-triphosphate,3'-diphosphate pyrophosphatase